MRARDIRGRTKRTRLAETRLARGAHVIASSCISPRVYQRKEALRSCSSYMVLAAYICDELPTMGAGGMMRMMMMMMIMS